MAKFQVQVTMVVEAHNDSEAWSIADAALDHQLCSRHAHPALHSG